MSRGARLRLVATADGRRWERWVRSGDEVRLGQAPENDWSLPVAALSRQHARISVSGESAKIFDRGSRHGIVRGGRRILQGVLAADGPGAHLGPVHLCLQSVSADDLEIAIPLASKNAVATPEAAPGSTASFELPHGGHRPGSALQLPAAMVVGPSPAMARFLETLERYATRPAHILIHGETGTGKEMVARAVHDSGPGRDGPFVPVHVGELPESLLEAELFGVARGAATGVEARLGRLAEAAGGTLFLDEIGEMPPGVQVKLLRALEEGEARPLGGQPRKVDFRIVAATHVSLPEALESGSFRADLFHRLSVTTVTLPSLRERREDIPMLCARFLEQATQDFRAEIHGISRGALEALTAYPWPGNIRELRNRLRQAVLDSDSGETLERRHFRRLQPQRPVSPETPPEERLPLGEEIERLITRRLLEALDATSWDKARAARRLPLARATVYERLGKLREQLEAILPDCGGDPAAAAARLGLEPALVDQAVRELRVQAASGD